MNWKILTMLLEDPLEDKMWLFAVMLEKLFISKYTSF